jgi:hypothetical protein
MTQLKATKLKAMWPMRILIAAVLISTLLTHLAYAQGGAQTRIPTPLSEEDRAEMARKRVEEQANDEAYKSTLKRLPNANQKVDPWGGVRTPPATGNK